MDIEIIQILMYSNFLIYILIFYSSGISSAICFLSAASFSKVLFKSPIKLLEPYLYFEALSSSLPFLTLISTYYVVSAPSSAPNMMFSSISPISYNFSCSLSFSFFFSFFFFFGFLFFFGCCYISRDNY